MSGYRHEWKYLVSSAQIPLLRSRITRIMQPDAHVNENGSYLVRSLYFDDPQNRCYYENENGTDPREKYRLRIYNHDTDRIALECKRKERGMVRKTSCLLTIAQAQSLLRGEAIQETDQNEPFLQAFCAKMRMQQLRPAVIVEYERIPFVYAPGNVRITFDLHISSCAPCSGFLSPALQKRPVMPPGQHLMEVKYDAFLPDYLYRGLHLGTLQQTAYSKYYLCRKFALE